MSVEIGKEYKNKHSDHVVTVTDREETPSARGIPMSAPGDFEVQYTDGQAMMHDTGNRTGGLHSGWIVIYVDDIHSDGKRCEEVTFLQHWELVEK